MAKIGILTVIVGVSALLWWLIGSSNCWFHECLEDDASTRAVAVFGPVLFVFYVIVTLAIVFLPALHLRMRFSNACAAAIPSAAMAILISIVVFDPEIDSWLAIVGVASWFAISWFTGCVVGLKLWPSDKSKPSNQL